MKERAGINYPGTNTEIVLGDRVDFPTLFLKRSRIGTIVCIPDKTGRQRAEEGKEPEDILLRFDRGTYTGWMYAPEDVELPKRLKFLSRGVGTVETITNEELDALDEAEYQKSGGFGSLVGCAVVILVMASGLFWLFSL